jgi:hypothetical protein
LGRVSGYFFVDLEFTKDPGKTGSTLVSEDFIGMAEKCSCIFGMSAIHGGQIR